MESLVIIVHVLAAIGITGLVLIQQGKGADMGASFGSGASQTIFGSVGSGNALTKSTSWLAVIFFATSLTLALFARQQVSGGIQEESLLLNPDLAPALTAPVQQDLPVVPASSETPEVPPVPEAGLSAQDAAEAVVGEVSDEVPAEAGEVEAEAATEN